MTSTPVNVQGFASGALYGANRMQGTETKGDFSKIFESQKNVAEEVDETACVQKDIPQEETVEDVKEPEDVVKAEETASAENQVEAEEKSSTVQESSESNEGQSATQKDMEECVLTGEELLQAVTLLSGAVADVKEVLMQELNLTEEELHSLMQECNLQDMDLLQLGNVKELVLQAAGAEDMTALLTNEGLYSQSKSIEAEFANIMNTVQQTLEMNPEEVQTLVEQIDEMPQDVEAKAEEPVLVKVEVEKPTAEVVQPKVNETVKQESAEQNPTQENNLFAQQNPTTQQPESIQTTSVQNASYVAAETENIMRQIMDHMSVQLKAESTELNMQLHPESLGTLQIRISAKEGIMTAQFTTTSETVKGVLESQMIQLQQQFEQQNIKVDAIEVTVQSHAFESALEKGNEHQASEEETKKNRTRRIDLSGLEGLSEVETEDKILAEMMEVNGNSVDYLV